MTLEEAIKILKKEGFKLEGPGKPGVVNKSFAEYESREICEAMQTACCAGFQIMMLDGVFEARKARLRLELAENTKTPGPGEEQPKEGNPALAEAASQFNDALLDEQGKKIKRFGKEIARLNKIIHKKNLKIAEKDEVITDLGKELKAMKQQLDSYTKMAQKMAEVIAYKKPVTVDFFEMCWELAYSEEKKATEELSKVLNDVIDRFLLFGGIIIKEE